MFLGAIAIREIRAYQKSTNLLLPRLPFERLIREIAQNIRSDIRFQSGAVLAIQEATEAHIIAVFEDTLWCAHHAKRSTILAKGLMIISIPIYDYCQFA